MNLSFNRSKITIARISITPPMIFPSICAKTSIPSPIKISIIANTLLALI